VQTLNPFDVGGTLARSVENTRALIVLDEDLPRGASAFILQQVLEAQGAWRHLDAAPSTLAASPNRAAYGPDGDYFTKPNRESIVGAVYEVVRERQPWRLPPLES